MTKSLSKHDIVILKWLHGQNKPIYQSDIPKLTGMDLKIVTKSLYKLEKMGLVYREPVIHNKRRTYVVKIDNDKVLKALEEHGESLFSIQDLFMELNDIPCVACPYLFKCYEGGFYDPIYCQYLTNYLSQFKKHPSSLVNTRYIAR